MRHMQTSMQVFLTESKGMVPSAPGDTAREGQRLGGEGNARLPVGKAGSWWDRNYRAS